MVAAAEKAGRQVHHGLPAALRHRLADGEAACSTRDSRAADAGLSTDRGRPLLPRVPWFLQKQLAGGGILMDWGIYTAYFISVAGRDRSTGSTPPNEIFREEVMVARRARHRHRRRGHDRGDAVASRTARSAPGRPPGRSPARHGTTVIDGDEGSILMRSGSTGSASTPPHSTIPTTCTGWRQLPVADPAVQDLHYRKLAHLVDSVLDDTPLVHDRRRRPRRPGTGPGDLPVGRDRPGGRSAVAARARTRQSSPDVQVA